jgi:excinuclease ABC subunit A
MLDQGDFAALVRALVMTVSPWPDWNACPYDTPVQPPSSWSRQSHMMKRRVAQFLSSSDCPACHGKRLRPEAISVKFDELDIADISRLPLKRLDALLQPYLGDKAKTSAIHAEKAIVIRRIVEDLQSRLSVLLDLGLG